MNFIENKNNLEEEKKEGREEKGESVKKKGESGKGGNMKIISKMFGVITKLMEKSIESGHGEVILESLDKIEELVDLL